MGVGLFPNNRKLSSLEIPDIPEIHHQFEKQYALNAHCRTLNLESTDADLKGFFGGFTDGRYGYFVPYNNGAYHGKIARVDLSNFSTVSVLDLTSTDADLKGFFGGFTDGRYGYFVPNHNGAYFGKIARIEMFGGGQL